MPKMNRKKQAISSLPSTSGTTPGNRLDERHDSLGSYQHPFAQVCKLHPPAYSNYEQYELTFHNNVDHYELLQKVGRGKYSEVFRGRHKPSGALCVLKVLKPVMYRRVQREIMILTLLCGGPNVVRLLDVLKYHPTNTPVLVTECVEKATHLRQLMHEHLLSNFDIRYYIYEILRTLDFAHRNGIIHRDIKPHNIMIDHKHRIVRVIDWGLAEFYIPSNSLNCSVATRHYKPPELLVGNRNYDYSLDIWCLGCVLAGLLFRIDPFFCGDSNEDQLIKILEIYGTQSVQDYVQKYGGVIPDQVREAFPLLPTSPIPWSKVAAKQRIPVTDETAFDLITNMLQFDHQDRLTASECMHHPFFLPVVEALGQSPDEQYPMMKQK